MTIDIGTIALWALAIFSAIVGAITIIIESRPRPGQEKIDRYLDYSSETQVENHVMPVELGRIPYLNQYLFRRVPVANLGHTLLPINTRTMTIQFGSTVKELQETDWFDDAKEMTIYIRREACPGHRAFVVTATIIREKSKKEIGKMVTLAEEPRNDNGKLSTNLRINNMSMQEIRSFELIHPIPGLAEIKAIQVRKWAANPQTLDYTLADFGVRSESSAVAYAHRKGRQGTVPSLVGVISLEPGITDVTFEYTLLP